MVPIDGCPFSITTPNETTAPVKDDGAVGAAPDPRDLHLAYVGDPKSTISVTWATDVGTRGTTLEWGADTSYGHKTPGLLVRLSRPISPATTRRRWASTRCTYAGWPPALRITIASAPART